MNTHRWINLPGLSRWEKTFLLLPLNISCRGRRGHTMTTIEGKLAVMGGAAKINGKESLLKDPSCSICETRIERHWSVFFCGPGGDTEYLDDVEIFDGRRWKRANYKLDQVKEGKVQFTTSSRRLDGGAYCGAPVGGKCMVSKAKLVLYAFAV